METKPNSFIVGVFVLSLLVLGTFFVVWFSKLDLAGQPNLYNIYFDGAVTGLRENEDVLYQGIAVGKVKRISVYKKDVQRVKVLVNISRPDIIRENSIATVEAQGLTGYTFVQIKGSTQDSPLLQAQEGQKRPVIRSRTSNLEALFSNAPKILEDISKVAQQVQKLLDDKMIADSKATVSNLSTITKDLSYGAGSLATFLADFTATLKDFKQASASFDRVLKDNEAALSAFTKKGLPAFTKMSQSLQRTADDVDRMVNTIEKSPASFLRKNSTQGYVVK